MASPENQEDDDTWQTPSTPTANPSKKLKLTNSPDSVNNRDIGEHEERDTLSSDTIPLNSAENKDFTKEPRGKLTTKPAIVELADIQLARAKFSISRGLVGGEPSNSSSCGSNSQSPETESSPEKVAMVRYNYIFKIPLNNIDANGTSLQIPREEAQEHFPPLQNNGESVTLQLYDLNRKQILEWGYIRHDQLYCVCREWKEYVDDNQLKEGDFVVFYKTDDNQYVNNELAPHYAIQF